MQHHARTDARDPRYKPSTPLHKRTAHPPQAVRPRYRVRRRITSTALVPTTLHGDLHAGSTLPVERAAFQPSPTQPSHTPFPNPQINKLALVLLYDAIHHGNRTTRTAAGRRRGRASTPRIANTAQSIAHRPVPISLHSHLQFGSIAMG